MPLSGCGDLLPWLEVTFSVMHDGVTQFRRNGRAPIKAGWEVDAVGALIAVRVRGLEVQQTRISSIATIFLEKMEQIEGTRTTKLRFKIKLTNYFLKLTL